MKKPGKFTIFFIIFCIVLVSVIGSYYYKQYRRKQHRIFLWEQFDERMDTYIRLLPEKMPLLCKDLPVQGTVTAAVVTTNMKENTYSYEYTIDCVFTLETAANFDNYSIQRQQDFLRKWESCASAAERDFRNKYLAEYDTCMRELCSYSGYYDKHLWMNGHNRYCISTPEHTYRYTGLHKYINIDGREIYIKEKKKNYSSSGSSQSSPERSSGSTGKGSRKWYNTDDDYYGAGDYIDADDFASDWEDSGDFEDYDDAYDYYEEVMGHD